MFEGVQLSLEHGYLDLELMVVSYWNVLHMCDLNRGKFNAIYTVIK